MITCRNYVTAKVDRHTPFPVPIFWRTMCQKVIAYANLRVFVLLKNDIYIKNEGCVRVTMKMTWRIDIIPHLMLILIMLKYKILFHLLLVYVCVMVQLNIHPFVLIWFLFDFRFNYRIYRVKIVPHFVCSTWTVLA